MKNWYKKIKISAPIEANNLEISIIKSIELVNDGNWTVTDTRHFSPNFKIQIAGRISMNASSVKYKNDLYDIYIRYKVKHREPQLPHPYDMDPLIPLEKRWEMVEKSKPHKFDQFDSVEGHNLLQINGYVSKIKLGTNDPEIIQTTEHVITGKEVPIRIEFISNSPYNVAYRIKYIIDNFNKDDNDDNDKDDSPNNPFGYITEDENINKDSPILV